MNESVEKSQQVEEVDFQLAHIRLSGKRYGDKDKPILLSLHGWLDNADSFEPLAQALMNQGVLKHYQLLAIDWPGHGKSQHRPGSSPLHWIDYLYDLDELINVLVSPPNTVKHAVKTTDNNIKQTSDNTITIIGHSLGGIIAAAYNACFPEKIVKLVLIEALSPIFEKPSNAKNRLINSFKQHHRFNESKSKTDETANSERTFTLERAVNARNQLTGLDKHWCELIIKRNVDIKNQQFCWKSDPRLKLDSPYRLTFEQVDALMTMSDTPCLLILGEQGFKQLKLAIPQAKSWFSQISHLQIPGDHHLHMGSAEIVANKIRTFILS
ncbi:alpha/beta fold hydrolase [Shewanella donghaensis]|uniref:alpha/beta fold hydrolase n=1 Tax=Shewanella donghaensis TaxID=238836 RepID=UPI001182748B|nr:alpha/beta hydrolase [Shewanella donghaensis]